MFLNKILQPLFGSMGKNNWKSRNPETRKRAVQAVPVSEQETLLKIAMTDSDDSIGSIAAGKLHDLDSLQTLLIKSSSEAIKQAAQLQFFQLLCGMKHPIPDYDSREKIIHGSRNSVLLEFIAANADQAALREITINKINREPLLGDISLTDENPKVRQLAAQQISKRSTLERVVKNSRRKDKRVYKIVKHKLDKLIEDEKRPIRLAEEVLDICDKLEKLHKRNLLKQEQSTFNNYVTRWSEINQFANDEITQRYKNIKSKITNNIIELDNKQSKEHEVDLVLKSLLSELSHAVDKLLSDKEKFDKDNNNSESESAIASDHASIAESLKDNENIILKLGREWDSHIALLQNQQQVDAFNNQFFSILELSESTSDTDNNSQDKTSEDHALKEKDSKESHIEKIQNLINQAESIAENSSFIFHKTVTTLQDRFNQQIKDYYQADKPDAIEKLESLKLRFSDIYKKIDKKLLTQQMHIKQLKAQIEADTKKTKAEIDDGSVTQARKLLQTLIKQIDKSHYLSQTEKNNYLNELNPLQSEVNELSSWQNWAHDNERENLLNKANKLFQQAENNQHLNIEYKEITAQVKQLRQQWKKMRSHTAEDLWQKFNQSCNASYELCVPFIQQKENERHDNFAKKEALCKQLEDYISNMQWSADDSISNGNDLNLAAQNINWIQVDKITRQARKEWSEIGFVNRNQHKEINLRFEQSIQTIRDELNKAWQINLKKFEELVTKTQNLHPFIEDDLPDCINKAKQYQHQWKSIGPVSPSQRKKVWKKFRLACDVIFNKRQENIDEKNSQNDEIIREKEAICENLEALNLQPLTIKDLENAYADIKKIWMEIQNHSKSLGKAQNQRYVLAEKEYFNKLEQLEINEHQKQQDLLNEKALICTEIEALISDEKTMDRDNTADLISQYGQQWHAKKLLSSTLESVLSKRFKQALEQLESSPSVEQIQLLKQQELKLKQAFCLKFEILTSKQSPDGYENERMEMQVTLLKENMGQTRQITVLEIQQQWYKISNYTQDKDLQARFINLTN